jgi:hypothetical protein
VFYQSLERLRNSLGFWYSEFSHISFGIRFKVQICPDSLIYLELISSSIPLLVIITPEPSVGWGIVVLYGKVSKFSIYCVVFLILD